MTKRKCPWCGGANLLRTGSNTLQDTRPGDHPYYIEVVYWEDRDCGYREVTTPDERYDYSLHKIVEVERDVLRFHKPNPPLPEREQPEYLRRGIVAESAPIGQLKLSEEQVPV